MKDESRFLSPTRLLEIRSIYLCSSFILRRKSFFVIIAQSAHKVNAFWVSLWSLMVPARLDKSREY